MDKIKEEALEVIKKNTYKEQMIKDSLLVLEDLKNIKAITTDGFDCYSYNGVAMFQDKISKNILRILTVEKMLNNDILKKYQLDGYREARHRFSEHLYDTKSYHQSAYFTKDKEIVLNTLFKYDKKTFFNYKFNHYKFHLLGGAIAGIGIFALKRFIKIK
jgi:hypothetical protein